VFDRLDASGEVGAPLGKDNDVCAHPIAVAFDFVEPLASDRRPNPGVGDEGTIKRERRRTLHGETAVRHATPGSSVRTLTQYERKQAEEPGPHCRIRMAPSKGSHIKLATDRRVA
jgi:hypothetical protein